ncbi:MAG: branched-chain amino acid ABC transporter permease [Deltaproteobacteria bacterium]|nr:branched-chain amino acid ABC transporter permease [Deltaproteobacteria bacterium]MBM4321941.1 branched-chain amino acid ABC transporter permease [Deltaproteobacteria bacterium]
MGYLFNILILGGLFSILSVSLNIACGYTGILSLAHASFYGVGAYTVGLLTTKMGVPFWTAFLLGGVFAGICGLLIGIPTLRLKGDYFLIATLGFGEIFSKSLINWDTLTEGARGITNIPPIQILGIRFDTDFSFFFFLLLIWIICVGSIYLIEKSPFGQILFSIAEDEDGVAALGRNPTYFKVLAMGLSAFWAGIAGGLYASYVGYINPNLFTINESILIFTMVLLGGLRSIHGVILGAFVLVALPELMRFIGLPGPFAAVIRQMIYGMLLILIMYFRPRGLLGRVKLR